MSRRGGVPEWLGAGLVTLARSSLARRSIGIGGLTGAEIALGLIAAIMLARDLGTEGFGAYSLAFAVAVLAALPVEFGLPGLITREIAHSGIDPESGAAKGIVVFALIVIAVMSVVIVPLVIVFGNVLAPGVKASDQAIFAVAALLIPLGALGRLFGAALAGGHRVVLGAFPQKFIRPGVFAIMLGIAAVLEPGWLTPVRAMALQAAAGAVALVVAAALFWRRFSGDLARQTAWILWRGWTVSMFRLGVSNGIQMAQPQVLLLLTGALSSVENVGLLRVAQRGAAFISIGGAIASMASAPQIARLFAEGRRDLLQRLLTQVARAGFAIAALGLACFVVAGHWLLTEIFGEGFGAAWSLLILLSASETLRILLGPGVVLMNMARREGVTALGFSISLAISAVMAVAMIPVLGVIGAGFATFSGGICMAMFVRHRACRTLQLDPAVFGGPIGSQNQKGLS